MSFRSTTFLFALLLAMLWLFGLTVAHKKTAVDERLLLASLQAHPEAVIDTVVIERKVKDKKPEEFEFIKDKANDVWTLKIPGVEKSVKLENFRVDQIVRQVKEARRSDEAEVSEDLARYGLSDPTTTVTLKGKVGEKKEEWKLFVGKQSAYQAFIYANSSDRPKKAYAIGKNDIDSVLFKDPNSLRARRLFEFSDMAAQSVDVKDSVGELELKKAEDGSWRFEKPGLGFADFEGPPAPKELPPGTKAPEGGVKGLLSAISTIRVDSEDDFVPLSDAKLETFGLEEGKEAMRIEVGTQKEKLQKKELAKETLAIGSPVKDKAQVYARMLSDQGVFKLNAKLLEPLKQAVAQPGSLRSLDVVTMDVKKVDAVTVAKEKEKVALLHPDGKPWEVEAEGGKLQKGNAQAIQALLDSVQGKREIVRFYDGEEGKKLDAQMKAPQAVVAVYVGGLVEPKKDAEEKDGKKDEKKDETPHLKKEVKAAATLTFGTGDKDTVNVERVLADGTTTRFAVNKSLFDRIIPGDVALAYLENALPAIAVDDIERIQLDGLKEKIDVERGWGEGGKRWYFKETSQTAAKSATDAAKTDAFVSALANLAAKRWLKKIDPKEDLDKYGLGKPALEVTLVVKKERPATTVSLVGMLATLSEWRGVLGGASLLARRQLDPGEKIVLKIGKETTEEKDKPAVYAQRSDKDMLFLLPADAVRSWRELDLHDRTVVITAQPLVDAAVIGLAAQDGMGSIVSASPLATNWVQSLDAGKVKELKLAIRMKDELRHLIFQRDPRAKENEWRDASGLQEFNLDSAKVNQFLDQLASLKASRWVNLAGGAKVEQKLTPKEALLRIEAVLDDGKTITLTVGAAFEKMGYYAQTSLMPDAVFLLPPTQVEPLLMGPGHFAKERIAGLENRKSKDEIVN